MAFRRARVVTYCSIAILGLVVVARTTQEAYAAGGIFPATFMLLISGFLTIIICILVSFVIEGGFRIAEFMETEGRRRAGIKWENKVFHIGDRVLINRDDPDFYENPMVIRPEESPHSAEIDCDNGHTGVVVGGSNFGSLAVQWDAQEWCEHMTRRKISLPSFESSIHPDHMDLASGITADNPLKVANRTPPNDRSVDLSNKDWLQDRASKTPMRDFVELPHEVLTNDYFIGLLGNAAVAAIGRAHHQLPRTVIQKIAIQLLRRAEQDRSLAHFLELSKSAEAPWTFDWEKAAAE